MQPIGFKLVPKKLSTAEQCRNSKRKRTIAIGFDANDDAGTDTRKEKKREFIGGTFDGASASSKARAEKLKKVASRVIPVCKNPWDDDAKINSKNEKSNETSEERSSARVKMISDRDVAAALVREATGEHVEEEEDTRVIPVQNADDTGGEVDASRSKNGKKKSQLLAIVMKTREKLGRDSQGNMLSESQRLRRDLDLRPVEETVDDTEWSATPIEGFGSAMLRGMGWKGKGTGIGLTRKKTKPIEALSRPTRLGLGATAKPWERRRGGAGRQSTRSRKGRNKLGALQEGYHVGVLKGPYEGDVGRVVDVMGTSAIVALEHYGDKSQPGSFLVVIDSPETFRKFTSEHPPPKKNAPAGGTKSDTTIAQRSDSNTRSKQEREEKDSNRSTDDGEGLDTDPNIGDDGAHEVSKSGSKSKGKGDRYRHPRDGLQTSNVAPSKTKTNRRRKPLWVRPHIRVRMIGRKHYRKKGRILDVLDPVTGSCLVQLDSGGALVEGVVQKDLETVLPKRKGAEVIVVGAGSMRGTRGRLHEINKRREFAYVQLHSDLSLQKFHLDDVCEYLGGNNGGGDEI
eukprot:g2972.t1